MPVQPNSGAISMVLPSAEWILTRPWEVTFCCCSCMWIMQRENAVLITVLYNECRGSVDYGIAHGTVMKQWFGVGPARVNILVDFAEKLGVEGAKATQDGMVEYAKHHPPQNSTPGR